MSVQDLLVLVIVAAASVHLSITLGPMRWRGRILALLRRVAHARCTPTPLRALASSLGRALSPSIDCAGCAKHTVVDAPTREVR